MELSYIEASSRADESPAQWPRVPAESFGTADKYREMSAVDTADFVITTHAMIVQEVEDMSNTPVTGDEADDSWPILLQTLGMVSLLILLRLLLWELVPGQWRGRITMTETTPMYTGLFFLLGAVFNAVNADFKEAEKLPMEIANSLEQLEDTFRMAFSANAERNGAHFWEARFLTLRATRRAHAVLLQSGADDAYKNFSSAMRALNELGHEWERRGATNVHMINISVDKVRRAVSRGSVIARTDNLLAMRAVLIYFVSIGTITLCLTTFSDETTLSFVLAGILVVFWFLIRVILAVDDPFDQSIATGWRRYVFGQIGCVTLYPLRDLVARLADDLQAV